MTQQQLMQLGMALGICYAAYRFSSNSAVKAAAIAVGAVIAAKRVPVLSTALA